MCIWIRHKPLTPSYKPERMQISEYFTLDLWICYRYVSFCLPASNLLVKQKFDVCDSPQSGPYQIILPDPYSTWVFSEELKRYACLAVWIVLLCKYVPSSYLPFYLVHMSILIVIRFCSHFEKRQRYMFKWFCNTILCLSWLLKLRNLLQRNGRVKTIYSMFLPYLYSDV